MRIREFCIAPGQAGESLADRLHGGLTLSPLAVEAIMKGTATKTACPVPAEFTYTRLRQQADGTYLPSVSTALSK